MHLNDDKRIVMTLDAGGTNLVFSAMQGNTEIIPEVTLPSFPNDLERCLSSVVEGFSIVTKSLPAPAAAISFAFPGPADYPKGIIGDLPNLPAFRGGVALGPMLEDRYGVPVFINNDGDLYAFGESIAGFLPYVNSLLERAGSPKRYQNLLGVTLGTGFGGGIVRRGELFIGDNSIAGEMWLLRDKLAPGTNIEEHVSARGLRRVYALRARIPVEDAPSPKDIYHICVGRLKGDQAAAHRAFEEMSEAMGDALSNAITLIDGLIVIGGGLSGAADVFLPMVIHEMNSTYKGSDGSSFRRLAARVYNLEDEKDLEKFLAGSSREIIVHGSTRKVAYDPEIRIGIGVTRLGASKAIAIGAYAFALQSLDR